MGDEEQITEAETELSSLTKGAKRQVKNDYNNQPSENKTRKKPEFVTPSLPTKNIAIKCWLTISQSKRTDSMADIITAGGADLS